MRAKTDYFTAYFVLEPGNGGNGYDHHRKTQGDTGNGDPDDGTGKGRAAFLVESQARGYK